MQQIAKSLRKKKYYDEKKNFYCNWCNGWYRSRIHKTYNEKSFIRLVFVSCDIVFKQFDFVLCLSLVNQIICTVKGEI
jgi:hypothetical protein